MLSVSKLPAIGMARLPRYFSPAVPLHVVQRGNDRQALFADTHDYRYFRECLLDAAQRHGLAIHAYVFMTNHFHLLATPAHAESVAKTLQSIGRRYVQHFNVRYGRTGPRWDGRYRATAVDSDAYLLACYRYIEMNPVRAQMVDHPRRFCWSSYRHNADGNTDELVTPHSLYLQLGRQPDECRAAYRALFERQLDETTLADIRLATNTGWALGGEEFQREVERLARRRAAPLARGRRPRLPDAVEVVW